jgi:hypothetical protein
MPANAVKPGQEKYWEKAKALAEEQGHGGDYAYIMGIFQRMVVNKSMASYIPRYDRYWKEAKRLAAKEGRGDDDDFVLQVIRELEATDRALHKAFVIPDNFRGYRTPGQVPSSERLEMMRTLTEKPKEMSVARLLEHNEPRLSPAAVVAGLGLDIRKQGEWARYVEKTVTEAPNELVLRQTMVAKLREERLDSEMRSALLQRTLSHWRGLNKSRTVRVLTPAELKAEQELEKGGPYFGPKGGKYRDPAHKIPWKDSADVFKRALSEKIKRHGPGQGREVKLSKRELKTVLEEGTFGLISAGKNPSLEPNMTAAEQEARHEKLRADLKKAGLAFTEVEGHYGEAEKTFLVMAHNIRKDELRQLGEKYNQESVIHVEDGKNEFHFTAGENKGKHHKGSGVTYKPSKGATSYTEVRHPEGGSTRFELNFEWEAVFKAFLRALAGEPFAKAEARGGSYHRRIPLPGGGYRYIYDEETYSKVQNAHISGKDAKHAYVKNGVEACVRAAGEKGCDAASFKELVRKHGAKEVAGALKASAVEYKKGRFYLIEKKDLASPKKEAYSAKKEGKK